MSEVTFLDDVYVELIDKMGTDASILQAARVSTLGANDSTLDQLVAEWVEKNQEPAPSYAVARLLTEEATKKDKGLLNYLMRDRHGSPFEHCTMKFYVKAPIFVFREWHRHRMNSYNEMSGRYTKLLPEFYVPRDDRPLTQVGKPGAYTFEAGEPEVVAFTQQIIKENSEASWKRYEMLLNSDVAKEVARAVLPVNTYSQMYVTTNLRSLMHFLGLRTKAQENSKFPSFPQDEISLGADKLEAIFAEKFPWTYESWQANGRVAP